MLVERAERLLLAKVAAGAEADPDKMRAALTHLLEAPPQMVPVEQAHLDELKHVLGIAS